MADLEIGRTWPTDLVRRNQIAPGAVTNRSLALPYGTSFPVSPTNGDVYFYQPAVGTTWAFRYNGASTSSYKWEFVGGPPLFAEDADDGTTTSTSYGDLTGSSVGPAVALPLAGDWDVRIESRSNQSNVDFAKMSYAIGGTAAVDADALTPSYNSGNERHHLVRTRRKTGLTAVTLTCKYAVGGAGTATYDFRSIAAWPVRVSG